MDSEYNNLKYGTNLNSTWILIIDSTKKPPKESLWCNTGQIPPTTNLEKYFAELKINDAKSFGEWFKIHDFHLDKFGAGPLHYLYSGKNYFIRATFMPGGKINIEKLDFIQLELFRVQED